MNEANDERWFSVILAEYNSLRTESMQSMQYQQSTLSIGTGAIGIVFGFGVSGNNEAQLMLLCVVIPLFAIIVYVLYGIEFMRMVSVGRYIDTLEQYVNSRFEEPLPLGWEGWLDGRGTAQKEKKPRIPLYWAVPLLFLLIAFVSIALGLILTPVETRCIADKSWLAAISVIISVFTVGVISKRLQSCRDSFSEHFEQQWRKSS